MKRRPGFEPTAFNKAMKDTCPILAAPDFTDTVEDLGHIFAQPEMQEFWRAWTGPQGARGSDVDYAPAKGVMSYMTMAGVTPYVDDAHALYVADTRLHELVGQIEAATFGRWPQAAVEPPPYQSLARHVNKVAPSCWREAMKANIAMVRALAILRPGEGIGERLLIDGDGVAAWCQQKAGTRGSDRDLRLRKRTPHAGFRAYSYGNNGKQPIDPNAKLQSAAGRGNSKWWRGYYLVVIADQATGLPLVWTLIDAATDEARTIVALLRDLYELWPDIPARLIAGDSAWDENEWCRLCEVDYGIHPVFRLHPSARDKGGRVLPSGSSRDGSIYAIDGEGRLICAVHRKPLLFDTYDRPRRVGKNGQPLRPGQTAKEGEFRIRARCEHSAPGAPPCGRPGLRMQIDWSALTRYPHYPEGDPRDYAMREALLVRVNQVDSLFNRLESGHLGTDGAARTRVLAKETVEALISLRLLSFTALSLADQRIQKGVGVSLPTGPLAPVPVDPAHRAVAPCRPDAGCLAEAPRSRRRGELAGVAAGSCSTLM